MSKVTVTFLPMGLSVEVERGSSILEAAQKGGVYVSNLCGGEGVCGECKVLLKKGKADGLERSKELLGESEVKNGKVLACQTIPLEDAVVEIPLETAVEGAQIMVESEEEGYKEHGRPLVQKLFLELPPPNSEDNIADAERVFRELRKKLGWRGYTMELPCLQDLPVVLREKNWQVTCVLLKEFEEYKVLCVEPGDTTNKNIGLAVDVGTTTVVAQLLDLASKKVLDVEGKLNSQASYGEDVISRIIYACSKGGLEPLQSSVVRDINELILELCTRNRIDPEEIWSVVAAGNTTMSHLLLGIHPCAIRLDPYVPAAYLYPSTKARSIGIDVNPMAPLLVIPSVASYVGGDIVAGVLACKIYEREGVSALIDIGTNGEIVLGNKDWLVCCSASAGPAFEGGGISCGMRATAGAIEKVKIEGEKVLINTIGNLPPKGICGSGLIDAIYELMRNKIIGQDGKFDRSLVHKRLGYENDIPQFILAYAEETATGRPIVITETDIDSLIKSKGAVFAALKCLIDYVGLNFEFIEELFVAGGFGNYIDPHKAIGIGLLPDIPRERIKYVGNTSLKGARQCLMSHLEFERALNISRSMTNIELSTYPPFMNEYVAALFLPHTEMRLFPSVVIPK